MITRLAAAHLIIQQDLASAVVISEDGHSLIACCGGIGKVRFSQGDWRLTGLIGEGGLHPCLLLPAIQLPESQRQ